MTRTAVLDRQETMSEAIEFVVSLLDEVVGSSDDALAATCALAERFQPDAIVGYTTIDSRSPVPTFQTAVYPRLPTWPFSKLHDIPIARPYIGTCAQAICEQRPIICNDVAIETGFDPTWCATCAEFGLHSVQSAPIFGFDGRPLGTFVAAYHQSAHSFDRDMTGFGVYAVRTILQKRSSPPTQ
jgi:GAF domain